MPTDSALKRKANPSDPTASCLVVSQAERVRVFRIVLIVLGVVFFVLAILRLNVREIDRTGLCGSIVQGSSHDDGGASTHDCNRLRHDEGVAAAAFVIVIVAVAALEFGVGHALYTRNR